MTVCFSAYTFNSRYNRVSNTYLISLDNFRFEASKELYDLLMFYRKTGSYTETTRLYNKCHTSSLSLTPEKVKSVINSIIERKSRPASYDNTYKHFKIGNFNFFNPILDLIRPIWPILLILSVYFILTVLTSYYDLVFVFNTKSFYSIDHFLFMIPIFYFSRFLFTPIHEFGHYVFYYIFSNKKDVNFYIVLPGLIHFTAFTQLDDVLFLNSFWKRVLVYLGGLLFEILSLSFIIIVFQDYISEYRLVFNLLAFRVLMSIIFNLNILSYTTDGHILFTDLIGFPTLKDSYGEWLTHKLNRKIVPKLPFNTKTNFILFGFTLLGSLFILAILWLNIYFFFKLFNIVIPLFTSLKFQLGVVSIFLLLMNILYFTDSFYRVYRKKNIIFNTIKIIKYTEGGST